LKAELWAAILPGMLSALAAAPLSSWADVVSMFTRRAKPPRDDVDTRTDGPPA
jgi:hypothetical protein